MVTLFSFQNLFNFSFLLSRHSSEFLTTSASVLPKWCFSIPLVYSSLTLNFGMYLFTQFPWSAYQSSRSWIQLPCWFRLSTPPGFLPSVYSILIICPAMISFLYTLFGRKACYPSPLCPLFYPLVSLLSSCYISKIYEFVYLNLEEVIPDSIMEY